MKEAEFYNGMTRDEACQYYANEHKSLYRDWQAAYEAAYKMPDDDLIAICEWLDK